MVVGCSGVDRRLMLQERERCRSAREFVPGRVAVWLANLKTIMVSTGPLSYLGVHDVS